MERQAGLCCLSLCLLLLFLSCDSTPKVKVRKQSKIEIPPFRFNADSAFLFIENQLAFGPRVPNSIGHKKCAQWIVRKLKSYGAKVTEQKADLMAYDGKVLKSVNIIASFNPKAKKRLFLCAHWDTRPIADQDNTNQDLPIPGANDGGSGVAILLEIARQLQKDSVEYGVDLIFFDAEDYGAPRSHPKAGTSDTWCLGSQYWSKHPHRAGYNPKYGILIDMVGAKGATFAMEGNSMNYAGSIMKRTWQIAHQLGHSQYFIYDKVAPIIDDHLFINQMANFPCIDIVHYDPMAKNSFGDYWHTHDDNIEVIDKQTLDAVGQTLMGVIKSEGLN